MGWFWDSKEEKEAKKQMKEAREQAEKARERVELENFLKKSDDEKFSIIFHKIKSIEKKNMEQDSEIDSAQTTAFIGIAT